MNVIKRINKKVWIALAIVIAIQLLFDPLTPIVHFGQGVKAKLFMLSVRQKWESQNISHYKFDIKVYMPLACIVGGSVEVKDGVVIRTGPSSDAGTEPVPLLDPGFTALENIFFCNYRNYTIPGLFNEVERWIKLYPSIRHISFDSKYGFISSFSFGSSGGNGLLSPTVSDCCGGFSIQNFQVLDE